MTEIKLTPPNCPQETIQAYESVTVQQNITDRAGSFNIVLPCFADYDINRFVVGTDVQITQDGHYFRGFVTKPPMKLNGLIKTLILEGADYTAKTQKIVCTESYTNKSISYIVADLFEKYVTWKNNLNIETCETIMTMRIPDLFLWDVMESLCQMSGYQWNVDANLNVNFFAQSLNANENLITENTFHKGSASFSRDASKLVNKLWVKGSNTLSSQVTETKTVNVSPIMLLYQPHNINVIVDSVAKNVGIQNIDKAGTKDFLLNYDEKLLIPDLCKSGSATITYQYQYPIKILLWEQGSLDTYGLFEDILRVSTGDLDLATQMGIQYLAKYSRPVLVGSLEPFAGIYNPGESVRVDIPNLGIAEDLIIKSVEYTSTPLMPVKIKLSLENTVGDLVDILKQFQKRLDKLEQRNTQNSNEVVQQYRTFNETVIYPKLQDEGISYVLHDFIITGMPRAGGFYL